MRKYFPLLVGILVCIGIAFLAVCGRFNIADFYRRLGVRIPGLPACPGCNVIVISLDVLRADALPCYGYGRNTSPALCSYAKEHAYFTNFYSASPYTMDDHFSMMTGLYPGTHHALVPFRDSLNPGIPKLPEMLKSRGYRTAFFGVTDDPNMPLEKGVGRGFAEIHSMERTDEGFSRALGNVETLVSGDRPVFAFVHSYMMHAPYLPGPGPRKFTPNLSFPAIPVTMEQFEKDSLPFYAFVRDDFLARLQTSETPVSKERNERIYRNISEAVSSGNVENARKIFNSDLLWLERWMLRNAWYWHQITPYVNDQLIAYLRGLYDERLVQTDTRLAPFLRYLDRPDMNRKTIVIITSDHGEEFHEHGFFEHDNNLFNTSLYVPFILAAPNIKNAVYNGPAGAVDIYPTIMDMLGIALPKPVDGTSLFPMLSGNSEGPRYAVSQYRGGVVSSIQDGSWKLQAHEAYNGDPPWNELYDLLIDPGETHNAVSAYPGIADRLYQVLRMRLESSPAYASESGTFPDWIDTMKQEKLIKTGYF